MMTRLISFFLLGLFATKGIGGQPPLELAQQPLFTMQMVADGHLVMTPSVEWPTINSVANLGNFDASQDYFGYFDNGKCYRYHYSGTEAERHFYPVRLANDRRCGGEGEWSGNFLNWSVTQTVDPFRKALTGGLRVRDLPAETWLQKARHDGQGGTGIYPNRRLPASGNNATLLREHTPFTGNYIRMRIEGLGHRMRFIINSNDPDHGGAPAYDPDSSNCTAQACELSVRVKVCVPGLLEDNCRQYQNGWKPEGLLQDYSQQLQYSLFGYLNHSDGNRDGGVMRARMKYIGSLMRNNQGLWVSNPRREWDPVTGVLIRNPDADWAKNTHDSIVDSGVINYINKFGEMTTRNHKSTDPVSELYYTSLRYLRGKGNVPAYSNLGWRPSGWSIYELADGFPVIINPALK